MLTPSAAYAWAYAHPVVCLVLAIVLLSIANALMKGPPTSVLGRLVDRLSALARSDAKGTLSWPLIGRSIFEEITRKPEPVDPALGPARRDPSLTQTMRAVDPEQGGSGLRGFVRAEVLLVALVLALALPAAISPYGAAWLLVVGMVLTLVAAAGAVPRVVRWFRVALACAPLALVLAGCPALPPVSNCTPSSTRCAGTGPSATPQVCSQTQRWTSVELNGEPCATSPGAVCCATPGQRGRVIHACVPRSACVPEAAATAGPTSAPAALAESQKPAPLRASFDSLVAPASALFE